MFHFKNKKKISRTMFYLAIYGRTIYIENLIIYTGNLIIYIYFQYSRTIYTENLIIYTN